jgi:predicted anti-sigma-YlaC factor YlaD
MGEEHMPISKSIIEAAIVGFEQQKRQIDDQIAELRSMLIGKATETEPPQAIPGKRKKLNAAARRKMALAQKARWAKIRGETEQPAPVTVVAPKHKRKLSAAGRAAIVAATKKMWAAKRAAQAKSAAKATARK